jgi:hypothetical protein
LSQAAGGLGQGSGASKVTSAANHFDWLDAAIGAVAGLGLALLAALSALAIRRSRDQVAITAMGGRAGQEPEMKRDQTIKRRRRLARSLERAAVPERPFIGRGPRYIVHPNVALACAPSLQAIATAVRDEARVLDADALRAVRTFITDSASPFFGRDATEALREADRLQHIVVEAETAVADQERVPAAA